MARFCLAQSSIWHWTRKSKPRAAMSASTPSSGGCSSLKKQ
nr:MAG TPA: hypothetical protein [Caudoviricetes sp.]